VDVGLQESVTKLLSDSAIEEHRHQHEDGRSALETVYADSELLHDLEELVEPTTRGDPMSPLRWTCKSLRVLADELVEMGHSLSYQTVRRLLKSLHYSLQGNSKTIEGTQHPDRNAQFEYINAEVSRRISDSNPAISVDTKKKELVGSYKNGGKEYRPKGQPLSTCLPWRLELHDEAPLSSVVRPLRSLLFFTTLKEPREGADDAN
jgi:Rhodopirellula transposase DDE domain